MIWSDCDTVVMTVSWLHAYAWFFIVTGAFFGVAGLAMTAGEFVADLQYGGFL